MDRQLLDDEWSSSGRVKSWYWNSVKKKNDDDSDSSMIRRVSHLLGLQKKYNEKYKFVHLLTH